MKLLRDTWLIFQRQMVLMLRNPIWVIMGIIQPVYYLLLFGPLLKPALNAPTSAEAYRFFVPGVLIMLTIFVTSFVGFGLLAELRAGVIERSRVTPVSGVALLLGRSQGDVVGLLGQCAIITVLAIAFGLSTGLGDVLLAFLLLALIALMLSAASYGAALKLHSEDAIGALVNFVSQPVVLLSGILLPMAFGPGWLRGVATWNPLYWAVEAARALFAGDPGRASVWKALLILSVLTTASVTWSARAFARSVR